VVRVQSRKQGERTLVLGAVRFAGSSVCRRPIRHNYFRFCRITSHAPSSNTVRWRWAVGDVRIWEQPRHAASGGERLGCIKPSTTAPREPVVAGDAPQSVDGRAEASIRKKEPAQIAGRRVLRAVDGSLDKVRRACEFCAKKKTRNGPGLLALIRPTPPPADLRIEQFSAIYRLFHNRRADKVSN